VFWDFLRLVLHIPRMMFENFVLHVMWYVVCEIKGYLEKKDLCSEEETIISAL